MSTTASDASSAPRPEDPLATLAALPGVPGTVESVRKAVDRVYGHRVMRRRGNEVTAEAALRAARGSAALSGADWALEEVRRRSDFGSDAEARTVGAALRLNAEAGQLLSVWSQSPLRVLARLHLVAAGGAGVSDRTVGRPRLAGESVVEAPGSGAAAPDGGASSSGAPSVGAPSSGESSVEEAPAQVPLAGTPLPDADEVAARLDGLARLVIATSAAPALVTAAVVHGELLALRPFGSYNGLVARAAERVVLIGSGLDPKSICPAEVGHAELGRAAYAAAFDGYLSGTPEGMAAWITHCGRAVELGVRESTAVCEALQRGAA
ncbi:oxidoreductase [Streptomyces sp. NPDC050509]|uniref:oxidoreductase n=1 Tax=Streptomyces sp. NPDC050509 TaxID=3365620 RepID=UPI003795C574